MEGGPSSYNRRMRWTDFFSHLEYEFAVDADPARESPSATADADQDFLGMCARAKAAGHPVAAGLATGEVLHVSPRAVSAQWFSGLVGGERGAGVVIPLAALEWIDAGVLPVQRERPALLPTGFSEVLTDMASREALVTIRTRHGDVAGVIVGVGSNFCDVTGISGARPGGVRRLRLSAIVAIFQGSGAWG